MNFVELRNGEVRRIPIPRTRVNKGKKKGPRLLEPRPFASYAYHYSLYSKLAYCEEPPVLLCEGVANQVPCPRGHYRLVGDPTA